MPNKHHEFSPSSLERLRLCPGSFSLSKGVEEKVDEYASMGKFLHECVANQVFEYEGQYCSPEEKEMVYSCIELVAEISKANNASQLFYEKKLSLSRKEKVITEGTADVVIVAPHKIIIIDWKFGWQFVPESHDNPQLATYAAAAMQEFNKNEGEVILFYPRFSKIDTFTFTKPALIADNVYEIISNAKKKDAPLNPSEKACQYCRAYEKCPAVRKAMEIVCTAKEANSVEHIHDINDVAVLSDLLEKSRIAKKLISSIEDRCKVYAMENDGECGDFILRTSSGARKVSNPSQAFAKVSDVLTADEFVEACNVSVSSLEGIYADKRKKNDGVTKKFAKEELSIKLGDIIEHGNEKKTLVRKNK